MDLEGSRDTQSRTKAQGMSVPREPVALLLASLPAAKFRKSIHDPSDTYLAPQNHEIFAHVARATVNENKRTGGRTLGRIVPFQRTDRSSGNSKRASHAIEPACPTHGEISLRARLVDIRKNLAFRSFVVQVALEHPEAFLNGRSLNPAVNNQAIPSGSRHLIIGDSF